MQTLLLELILQINKTIQKKMEMRIIKIILVIVIIKKDFTKI